MKPQQSFPALQNRKVAMEMENWRGRHVGRNWVGWLVGVAWVGSILASTILVVVCVGLARDVDNLRAELHSLKTTVDQHGSRLSEESLEEWTNTVENTPLQQLLSHSRTRRNAHIRNRPVTQLNGSGRPVVSGEYLLWTRPQPSTYLNSFNYVTGLPGLDFVVAIKIKTPGIYFIYSQVAFNGRTALTDISECGHEVVRTSRDESVSNTIQKSVITQDGEGRWYNRHNIQGRMFPLDTHSTFGVVPLRRHDTLRVQISPYCRHFARINMDQDFTYFGSFLINELHD